MFDEIKFEIGMNSENVRQLINAYTQENNSNLNKSAINCIFQLLKEDSEFGDGKISNEKELEMLNALLQTAGNWGPDVIVSLSSLEDIPSFYGFFKPAENKNISESDVWSEHRVEIMKDKYIDIKKEKHIDIKKEKPDFYI